MNEIVIISGKGGTGKTSMAASFAVLAERPVIADCDVDASDLHLLLKSEILYREKFFGGAKARIKSGHCIACGKCQELCNFNAVYFDGCGNGRVERTFRIDPFACEGCGVCVRFCAEKAIEFQPVLNGEWFVSQHPLRTDGPRPARRRRRELGKAGLHRSPRSPAHRRGGKALFDHRRRPAGDRLPGDRLADRRSLVSGRDRTDRFRRARPGAGAGLARHFEMPAAVCVNKWDLNPEMTERIESLARVPERRSPVACATTMP